jgi:hypothetical protein
MESPQRSCGPVVELRQYTLRPGARDVLIELFENELVESQEAVGIEVVGQFRDLGDPDRFVWLRSFPDLASRRRALAAFYGGPVWEQRREAANATMLDSDNVLLLRPARPGSGFSLAGDRPAPGADVHPHALIVATVCHLDAGDGASAVDLLQRRIEPALAETGAPVAATFVTEPSRNDFPSLPVREGENVLVWFSSFQDSASYERHVEVRSRSARWVEAAQALTQRSRRQPQVLRLAPTPRSRLR